jgi:hypothetical protein
MIPEVGTLLAHALQVYIILTLTPSYIGQVKAAKQLWELNTFPNAQSGNWQAFLL